MQGGNYLMGLMNEKVHIAFADTYSTNKVYYKFITSLQTTRNSLKQSKKHQYQVWNINGV